MSEPRIRKARLDDLPALAERSQGVRDMPAHEAAYGLDMSRRCALRAVL